MTRTDIHALSGIRTHDFSVQAVKSYASDLADSVWLLGIHERQEMSECNSATNKFAQITKL